jgi:GNAT superfamily N-acetyltransferase
VRLRPATRQDIPALARLVRACDASQRGWAGPELTIPMLEEEELAWELRFARTGAWLRVAEEDDGPDGIVGVVAYAAAQASRTDRSLLPGVAQVSSLFVRPDRWRRGIARTLLACAEEAIHAAGYERAQLWTLEGSPAEQVYAALGWARDGRREIHEVLGLPIVAYVKAPGPSR